MNFLRLFSAGRAVALAVCALLLPACANYSLGPTGALEFKTLYVAPVANASFAPQAQAPLTTALRDSLLQEGNLELTNQGQAEATLDVALVDYQKAISATQQNNTLNAQAYNLILTASCTLVDNRTGKVYFRNRQVSASIEAYVFNTDSFAESEYQAMPQLARELGRKIKDTVVSTW